MAGIDSFTKGCWHCDGADTSTTFDDASTFNHDLTAVGNAQVDTAQSKFGGASALFDEANSWLKADGSTDFDLGTGDFVVDWWMRRNDDGDVQALIDCEPTHGSGGGPLIFLNGGDIFYHADGNTRISGGAVAHSTWVHIAAVRSSGTTRLFKDGAQIGSDWTDATNYAADTDCPTFGAHANQGGTFDYNGWLDEIRISVGTDRGWSGGFTPPTEAYSADATVAIAAIQNSYRQRRI